MEGAMQHRILLIEDDPALARLLAARLRKSGYAVDAAGDGVAALAAWQAHPYDLVVTDYRLPGQDGLQVLRQMAGEGPLPPAVMVTGYGDERLAVQAMKLGVDEYLTKDPVGDFLELLPLAVERAFDRRRLVEDKRRAEEELRREKAFIEVSLDSLDEVFYVFSAEGKFLRWNKTVGEVTGYSDDEIASMKPTDLILEEDRPGLDEAIRRAWREGAARTDATLVTKDGRRVPYAFSGSVVRDEQGRPLAICGVGRDISERLRADEQIRVLSRFPDENPSPVLRVSPEGSLLYHNRASRPLLDLWRWLPGQPMPEEHRAPLREAFASGQNIHREIECQGRCFTLVFAPIAEAGYANIYGFDVTEKRALERELRRKSWELNERLKEMRCLFGVSKLLEHRENSIAGTIRGALPLIPPAWRFPEVACARVTLNDVAYATEDFRETVWKLAAPILVGDQLAGALEVCYLEERPESDEGPFLKEERELVDSLAERLGKIIERIKAANEVQSLKQRIEFILGATKTGLQIEDEEFNLHYVDPGTQRVYGDPAGRKCYEYFRGSESPCRECAVKRARESGGVAVSEQTMPREGNRPVQLTSIPFRDDQGRRLFATVVVDLTERKRMEAELSQAQKLEAIGRLAAGIAHEINTPTQYVGDNTRFLQGAFDDIQQLLEEYGRLLEGARAGDASPENIAAVEAAQRAADLDFLVAEVPKAIRESMQGLEQVASIVRAMKEFSHPGGNKKQAIDLNAAVRNTLTVCRNEWKYVADLETDLDPDLGPVTCLPSDVNQVVLNLVVNAAQAIAQAGGDGASGKGTITVRTRRRGPWAEIRIADTGVGIPEENRRKVFDPFFTTKPVGKGTGQGLAIAHCIVVERHGGTITFESEVGRGTTFIVRLPMAGQPGDGLQTPAPDEEEVACGV